jgi:hypothetical protein
LQRDVKGREDEACRSPLRDQARLYVTLR